MADMEADDVLYDDFGPGLEEMGDDLQAVAASTAGVGGAVRPASAGVAAPEPPLVTVPGGAADLYADLFEEGSGAGSTLLKTQVAELSNRAQQQEAQIASLQQQVDTLTQQNAELEARCATLTTNISSLYNTAKLELQRKDAEIQELRERLAAAGAAPARRPAPVVPTRPSSSAAEEPGQQAPSSRSGQGGGEHPQQQQQQQQREEMHRGRSEARGLAGSSGEQQQHASGSQSRASSQEAAGSGREQQHHYRYEQREKDYDYRASNREHGRARHGGVTSPRRNYSERDGSRREERRDDERRSQRDSSLRDHEGRYRDDRLAPSRGGSGQDSDHRSSVSGRERR